MALVGDGCMELLQPCLIRFMPLTGTFLRIGPCSASHHELTGSEPVRSMINVTLVVMVHGVGPKWELTYARSGCHILVGPEQTILVKVRLDFGPTP